MSKDQHLDPNLGEISVGYALRHWKSEFELLSRY